MIRLGEKERMKMRQTDHLRSAERIWDNEIPAYIQKHINASRMQRWTQNLSSL